MPSNVMTPRTKTGEVSFVATADTVGKRFLAPSGDRTGGLGLSTDLQNVYRMAHCGAGKKAAGVNKYDVLSGKRGGCYGIPGSVVVMTSGAAITAGAEVMSDANGKAIPWTFAASMANVPCGLAVSGVGATDTDVEIKLY